MRRISKNPQRKLLLKADYALQSAYRRWFPEAKCESCGRPFDLMHHFIPKSQSNFLRFKHENLIFLCSHCHYRHHRTGDPLVHGKIQKMRGSDWYTILELAKRIKKESYGKKELEEKIAYYSQEQKPAELAALKQ